jgi:phosphoribosyl-ATP pyrophosphohydrolase
MIDPKKCIEWNESFGNVRWEIDKVLEISLLWEETSETFAALRLSNKSEIIDWCIDTVFVVIGMLHKLGLTADQITEAYNIVCKSNISKLWAKKTRGGKVMKWDNFIAPDFSKIIETL